MTLTLLSASLLLSGCMVIGRNDTFEFNQAVSADSGSFAPDLIIGKNQQNLYLPFFWIYHESPPHDVVMLTFDHTFKQSSDPFDSIVIDSLQIERAGEPPVELVSPSLPLDQRTHKVAKGNETLTDKADVVFKSAITRREPFTLTLRGYALDTQGQRISFERRCSYNFKTQEWRCFPLTV